VRVLLSYAQGTLASAKILVIANATTARNKDGDWTLPTPSAFERDEIETASQASRPLAEYVADLGNEIVVLTDENTPVAAIVPLKATDRESLALSSHPEFLQLIEHSRAEFREGRTLSLEENRSPVFLRKKEPQRTRRMPRVHDETAD
jgi:antitoxin (DNA-binding transcriptional repressor) of toxin-antitoxin stability system